MYTVYINGINLTMYYIYNLYMYFIKYVNNTKNVFVLYIVLSINAPKIFAYIPMSENIYYGKFIF